MERSEVVPLYFKTPDTLFRELGIESPFDIKLEAIAQYCGATILYEPLEGSEARLLGYGHRAIITINEMRVPTRQRFSAAHELGHWMWDRGKMAFSCTGSDLEGEGAKNDIERRANRYAVDLLMPESMFRRQMESRHLGMATVQELAESFQTSLTATALRLIEFSPCPAILVLTVSGRKRWHFRGGEMPRGTRPYEDVRSGTAASELLKTNAPEPLVVEGPASKWLDLGQKPDFELIEDSLKLGQETVLSLLLPKDLPNEYFPPVSAEKPVLH